MADRLTLLDKWRALQRITRDHTLARNYIIVAMTLLDRYHDRLGGARASSRFIANVTGLARTRAQSSTKRLVAAGHFIVTGGGTGTRGRIYLPTGPTDGASTGPSDGATGDPTGPSDAASSGHAGGAATADSGPSDGANNPSRKGLLVSLRDPSPVGARASRRSSPAGGSGAARAARWINEAGEGGQ